MDDMDILSRATTVLGRKLHGSSLLQARVDRRDVAELLRSMGAIIDAASFSLGDRQKLLGLIQNSEDSDDDDMGAPDAEAYKAHTSGIIDVLEDLKEKAETALTDARKQETTSRHNFEQLKQSLKDQIKNENAQMVTSKQTRASSAETKASTEQDLAMTRQALSNSQASLKSMDSDCTSKAADHEASQAAWEEELKALADAKKALVETTGGAEAFSYSEEQLNSSAEAVSLLQAISVKTSHMLHTSKDLKQFEVANLIRKLARSQQSALLTQLAGRISATLHDSSKTGADPFAKVKSLISDLLDKLEKDASSEASHKEYCDKEYSATAAKIDEYKYDIQKLTSSIDKKKADSMELKSEVAVLQGELAEIARMQAQSTQLRNMEHETFLQVVADLERGLDGVRFAASTLREYYASDKAPAAASLVQQPATPQTYSASAGSASGIIGMLEVVESDFSKSLAMAKMDESTSSEDYEKFSMDNRVSTSMKSKDVEYKTKEAGKLDKDVTELSSDRESTTTQLEAELDYQTKLRAQCETRPETYEERVARRTAEVNGLKEALAILSGPASAAVLLQQPRSARHLRSAGRHAGVSVATHGVSGAPRTDKIGALFDGR